MKTTITLDFEKGESMICLVDGKFVQTNFTGNASCSLTDGGSKLYINYETELKDRDYPNIRQRVDADHCFHSLEEVLQLTGLAEIHDAQSASSAES